MLKLMVIGIFAAIALYYVPQRKLMRLYTVIALAIGYVGFTFIPGPRNDLWNHFSVVKAYENLTWAQVLEREHYKAYPVAKAYFYGIAKIFHNEHFLPAITVFLAAILFSVTLRKCAKRFELPKRYEVTAYVYFLCAFNFFYLASNIRNHLAVAIFVFFLYMDMVEKKHRILCFAAYIATIYIHSSMVVFIILRLVLLIKNRRLLFFTLFLTMFYTLFQDKIFEVLHNFIKLDILDTIEDKANEYASKDYSVWIVLLRGSLTIAGQLLVIHSCWGYMHNNNKSMIQYLHYTAAFTVFNAVSITNYWLFMRMSISSALLFPIVLAAGYGELAKASAAKQAFVYSTFAMNIVYLFLFQYSHM